MFVSVKTDDAGTITFRDKDPEGIDKEIEKMKESYNIHKVGTVKNRNREPVAIIFSARRKKQEKYIWE